MNVTRAEFERLAMEQIDMIDRLARTLTRDAAEADDLVQETYLRAIRAWQGFDLREHGIRPWLIRILRNTHSTRAVRAARQPMLAEEASLNAATPHGADPDAPTPQERWEASEELAQAMSALPPELRTALELWAVDNLSYQEIAHAFEIPIGTVMSRLHRAKRLLREQYERRQRITSRPDSYDQQKQSDPDRRRA